MLGASAVDETHLMMTAGKLGIDKSRFGFCLDYYSMQKYNFCKLQYTDKYRLILVGPMPHSTEGKAVSGRIDPTTAPEFEKAVMENLDGVQDFVLDLKDVPYTSSAGLRTLLLAQKRMMKQGSLTLKNVQRSVLEVLKVTGYIKFLNIQ